MADVYGNIDAVHKTTYAANVQLALQQKQPKLVPLTTNIASLKGKELQAVELIGSSQAIIDLPHSTNTPHIPPKHLGIYVKPKRISWGRTIPRETEIKAAVDYQSLYVQEGAAAVQRARDEIVMAAAYGDRLVKNAGADAPVATPLSADQKIDVSYGGANSGLTVKKIVRAITVLMRAEVDVDMEQLVLWHTAAQNESLYGELQIVSKEYRNKAQFEDKRVTEFMGIKLQPFNKLPTLEADATVRRCLLYAQSGLHSGDALPVTTDIEKNANMQYQPHPFIDTWLGATRSEDEKFVEILCKE